MHMFSVPLLSFLQAVVLSISTAIHKCYKHWNRKDSQKKVSTLPQAQ